jgi:hypothetical protein
MLVQIAAENILDGRLGLTIEAQAREAKKYNSFAAVEPVHGCLVP